MNEFRFLGNDLPVIEYANCRVVILPAPLEKTTSYGAGTKKAAREILKASGYVELFDEELGCEPCQCGIYTQANIPATLDHADFLIELEKRSSTIIRDGKFPIIIGGEHSLSIAPILAFKKLHPRPFSVLQLDAHTDLRYEYEKTLLSHACVMRRVYEQNIPIVSIGIRSISQEEAQFIAEQKIKIFYAWQIHDQDNWMEDAIGQLNEDVYITLDIDVMDPSVIFHTGTPEPGGLGWYQVLKIFRRLREGGKNILGFDLVEFAPQVHHEAQSFTCAKLIYKMIAYFIS